MDERQVFVFWAESCLQVVEEKAPKASAPRVRGRFQAWELAAYMPMVLPCLYAVLRTDGRAHSASCTGSVCNL